MCNSSIKDVDIITTGITAAATATAADVDADHH